MSIEKPGPDYVRVITVLPLKKNKWLINAAKALQKGRPYKIKKADLPRGFVIDPGFGPLPLGPINPQKVDFNKAPPRAEDFRPDNSEFFVVRGYVRAES